jgi:hypothetical protein
MSASICIDLFTKLANWENLTPLTSDPEEWEDVSEFGGEEDAPLWQNKRNPSCFSNDEGKSWYDVNDSNVVMVCAESLLSGNFTCETATEQPIANVDSPEFKAWFGDSKVVDGEGNPLVLYRGTTKPDVHATKRSGPSYTALTDVASVYSAHPTGKFGMGGPEWRKGATVTPVFMRMENPLDLTGYETITLATAVYLTGGLDYTTPEGLGLYEDIITHLMDMESRGMPFEYELPSHCTGAWKGEGRSYFNIRDWEEYYEEFNEIQRMIDDAKDEGMKEYYEEEFGSFLDLTEVDVYALVDCAGLVWAAKKKGFDGIIHDDVFEAGVPAGKSLLGRDVEGLDEEFTHKTWRPFASNQVKSIYNTSWSTDPLSSIGEAKKKQSAWVVLTCEETENVLFLERSDGKGWNFAGGGIDDGEEPIEAAARELFEETGLRVSKLESLGQKGTAHYFKGVIAKETIPVLNKEHRDYAWMKAEDTEDLILHKPTRSFLRQD